MFKKFLIGITVLGVLTTSIAKAEIIKNYTIGSSGNVLFNEGNPILFLQVNTNLSEYEDTWLRNFYIGLGMNKNKELIFPIGYYLTNQEVGIQMCIYRQKEYDDIDYKVVYGIFLHKGALKKTWKVIKRIGDIIIN